MIWQRYGASDEKADLEQYYGLDQEDEIALVINNEVVREDADTTEADTGSAPVPGKVYDGQYYVEYSVVRERINKRFLLGSPMRAFCCIHYLTAMFRWKSEAAEYTEITEKKNTDYTILRTEGRTAYIALPFIQEYTNMEYEVYDNPDRAVITSEWGKIQTARLT